MYLIKKTKLRGSELRVVIEAVVVQNNHPLTVGRVMAAHCGLTVGAVGSHLIVKLFDRRIGTLPLGLDQA
jgi:hypothetical protein